MSDTNGIDERTPEPDAEMMASHGGRAGWFRVACGFSALAAIGMGYQSWSIAHPSAAAIVSYPPLLAGPLAVGAVFFAWASFLAMRRRPRAGFFLLLGYVIPAVTLYAVRDMVVPPSLLLIVSMFALILATRRRDTYTGPAA